MQKYFSLLLLTASFSALVVSACNNGTSDEKNSNLLTKQEPGVLVGGALMVPTNNLISNIMNSADHSTLMAALKAAGLTTLLESSGPYTVFAPTNDAFNKLSTDTLDNFLQPEMKAALTELLRFHIVPGAVKAGDLKEGQKLKTVQGDELTVRIVKDKLMVNNAWVTIANIISSNGVAYIIDAVLMHGK